MDVPLFDRRIRPYDDERWGKMKQEDVLAMRLFNQQAFRYYILAPFLREHYTYVEATTQFPMNTGFLHVGPGAIVPNSREVRELRLSRRLGAERNFKNGEMTGAAAAVSLRPVKRDSARAKKRQEAKYSDYRYTNVNVHYGTYKGTYHVPYGWVVLVTRHKKVNATLPWTYEPVIPTLGLVDEAGEEHLVEVAEALKPGGMNQYNHLGEEFFTAFTDILNREYARGRDPKFVNVELGKRSAKIEEVPRGSFQSWHPGNLVLKPTHPTFGYELDSQEFSEYLLDYASHYPNEYVHDEVLLGVGELSQAMAAEYFRRKANR